MKKEGVIITILLLVLLILAVILYQKNQLPVINSDQKNQVNQVQPTVSTNNAEDQASDQSSLTGSTDKDEKPVVDDQTIEDKLKALETDASAVNTSLTDTAIDVMNE